MEGWLHVRKNCSSGSGFVWSERYFVLRDGQLGLFNRRDEPEPRRVYQLRSDCSVTVMEDKDGSTYLRVLWENGHEAGAAVPPVAALLVAASAVALWLAGTQERAAPLSARETVGLGGALALLAVALSSAFAPGARAWRGDGVPPPAWSSQGGRQGTLHVMPEHAALGEPWRAAIEAQIAGLARARGARALAQLGRALVDALLALNPLPALLAILGVLRAPPALRENEFKDWAAAARWVAHAPAHGAARASAFGRGAGLPLMGVLEARSSAPLPLGLAAGPGATTVLRHTLMVRTRASSRASSRGSPGPRARRGANPPRSRPFL